VKLCSIFLLILLDSIVIMDLRSFLWDFLMIRRNRGGMKKNLMKQSRKDRITLSYIEPLLKKNQKPYRIWHSLYLWVIYSLIPQYVLLLVALIALEKWFIPICAVFYIIKVSLSFVIRGNMDAQRVSKYSKYYKQYKKDKK